MGPIWYTIISGKKDVLFKNKLRLLGFKKISVAVGYLVALNGTVDIFQPRV